MGPKIEGASRKAASWEEVLRGVKPHTAEQTASIEMLSKGGAMPPTCMQNVC